MLEFEERMTDLQQRRSYSVDFLFTFLTVTNLSMARLMVSIIEPEGEIHSFYEVS